MKLITYHELSVPSEIEGEIAALIANFSVLNRHLDAVYPYITLAEEDIRSIKQNTEAILKKAEKVLKTKTKK